MTDRLAALLASTVLNGIDFVEVAGGDQTHLAVHFINTVEVAGTLVGPQPVTITGGEKPAVVPVGPVAAGDWGHDDEGRPLLRLTTAYPGDFSVYRFAVDSTVLDPYYATAPLNFKARCPSVLDCARAEPPCPPDRGPNPPIDYLARDFRSFVRALTDYSAVAYPHWVERSEADLGMMLLEMAASVGDDLAYLQDRVAAEATLATATQRRSVVRHARLVDYEPSPSLSARATVQLDVAGGPIPAGTVLTAAAPDGGTVAFEIGSGMVDPGTGLPAELPLAVDPRWNARDSAGAWRILPYWWDDSRRCLPAGATQMWVRGHGYGFPVGDPATGTAGLALLLDTAPELPLDPPVRHVVHLTGAAEQTDPLFGVAVTRLMWSAAEAPRHDHDLTRTHLAGNLLPATEGRRHTERFVTDPAAGAAGAAAHAVVRTGPDADCDDPRPVYQHTLIQGRLAWLAPAQPAAGADRPGPRPEIVVTDVPPPGGGAPQAWRWRPRLLDAAPFEAAYTVDAARYTDIRTGPQRLSGRPRWEYDGDDADTVRFGDGVFGNRPSPRTVFDVTYRVTRGEAGNIAADTLTGVDPAMSAVILAATNPFPAAGGADEEPLDQVRRYAPYAFRARQFRAVRPPDYDAAARELDWVEDAGTRFRWTGSWPTIFTTVEPQDAPAVDTDRAVALLGLLNRRRLAGYEVYTPQPRYADLDLVVTVCAHAWAFRGDVAAALAVELGTGLRADGAPAFFARGRFTFGQALERSELEIAAQRATGVDGVVSVTCRRRGYTADFQAMGDTLTVAGDEIVRVDNDPSAPGRGSLRIVVQGGK
ncbi:putative baseplate assembly protein [Catellatospora sp. TT07R-123]|uniref:hypothetical protein n=1 Tax=Catellatospora sp. TT07R-123 TaxID=2733863 RepID=UPI001B24176E|nr:hypothetical protein [Catellatospora sp. TT07R-123]GHJ47488.1 putative baseplate assembly protein [Catellatospora sp. TT07R-123]